MPQLFDICPFMLKPTFDECFPDDISSDRLFDFPIGSLPVQLGQVLASPVVSYISGGKYEALLAPMHVENPRFDEHPREMVLGHRLVSLSLCSLLQDKGPKLLVSAEQCLNAIRATSLAMPD